MAAVVDQRQRRVPVSRARGAPPLEPTRAAGGRPDVLAFSLEAPDAGPLVGQLVISAETAARHARRLRVPLALELDLLATHGTLHLVGYDDRDPVEADLMHRRERAILGATPDRLWQGLLRPSTSAVTSRAARSRPASPRSIPRAHAARP